MSSQSHNACDVFANKNLDVTIRPGCNLIRLYHQANKSLSNLNSCSNMKGSQQQGALVCFSLFREKRKKHKIWQFSNYVDFSCINEQDMFEIVNSGDFAMILLL